MNEAKKYCFLDGNRWTREHYSLFINNKNGGLKKFQSTSIVL